MNFYKRYPTDYQRKTTRLTLAQHGAYTLLLDETYSTETPLPTDIGELFRICRAMNKSEQEAVRLVADRFFPINGTGKRHNKRADKEIEAAAPAIEAARENGRSGGRPKKPNGLSEANPGGSKNKTQKKPNSKAPQISERSSSSLCSEEDPSPSASDLVAAGFDERSATEFIACKEKRKAPLTARAWRDHLAEAMKAGWSPLKAAEKVMAKTWKGFEARYVAGESSEAKTTLSYRERDTAIAAARVRDMSGGLLDDTKRSASEVIDLDDLNATRIADR